MIKTKHPQDNLHKQYATTLPHRDRPHVMSNNE